MFSAHRLIYRMVAIAHGRLRHLSYQGLCVAEHQVQGRAEAGELIIQPLGFERMHGSVPMGSSIAGICDPQSLCALPDQSRRACSWTDTSEVIDSQIARSFSQVVVIPTTHCWPQSASG
jgi:hypothetical protein